jgi:hypothetical protein
MASPRPERTVEQGGSGHPRIVAYDPVNPA